MFVDLPIEELRAYRPDVAEPADFDTFWADQLTAARGIATAPGFTAVDTPLVSTDVFDVSFAGYAGDAVRGWLLVPHTQRADSPVVVEYIGYNGGRGDPLDWLPWSASGFVHLVMDSRGQGGGWRGAATPDPHDLGEPSANGLLTRGIADPRNYYYTRLYVDAVRAVDAVLAQPDLAGRPIMTTGASQGGALAIVAAAHHEAVAACAPDVPFLAHPRRAAMITDSRPFGELAQYCAVYPDRVATVFDTLSYVDVVNHAKRARASALFSVALLDDITPASTVFAAYNHYGSDTDIEKDIAVFEFNDHAGGGTLHQHRKLQFAAAVQS